MTKIRYLLTGLLFLSSSFLFSQSFQNKYSFGISSGYGFEEKKPVVYFNLNYYPVKEFYVGIKAGCYTYNESIDEAASRVIANYFPQLPVGTFEAYLRFKKQNPTYVAALNGGYILNDRIKLNLSLGVKYYSDCFYSASYIRYTKSYMGQNPPEIKITHANDPHMLYKKDILHGYISAGLDYKINSYSIGIFADNIFSAGINLGKEF